MAQPDHIQSYGHDSTISLLKSLRAQPLLLVKENNTCASIFYVNWGCMSNTIFLALSSHIFCSGFTGVFSLSGRYSRGVYDTKALDPFGWVCICVSFLRKTYLYKQTSSWSETILFFGRAVFTRKTTAIQWNKFSVGIQSPSGRRAVLIFRVIRFLVLRTFFYYNTFGNRLAWKMRQ